MTDRNGGTADFIFTAVRQFYGPSAAGSILSHHEFEVGPGIRVLELQPLSKRFILIIEKRQLIDVIQKC